MSAPASGPHPLRLRLTGPSLPAQLPEVRSRMAAWAGAIGLTGDAVDDLVLATHEALANVADHAYADGDGEALLDAECRGEEVVVAVRDRGRWRPPLPDPGWRGRGLLIIQGLAERVEVHHGAAGTTVEMHWPLPWARNGYRPAR
ncbi:ATP-binding protein [Pseudonocardia nigra]|uniref:ATP-binding protein n=1 Tax=Pseudonocardia nigra TaxID=1921578 RepID=UPI001C5EA705|nr:ATP-binding protein [Pseudonocardia nigra]